MGQGGSKESGSMRNIWSKIFKSKKPRDVSPDPEPENISPLVVLPPRETTSAEQPGQRRRPPTPGPYFDELEPNPPVFPEPIARERARSVHRRSSSGLYLGYSGSFRRRLRSFHDRAGPVPDPVPDPSDFIYHGSRPARDSRNESSSTTTVRPHNRDTQPEAGPSSPPDRPSKIPKPALTHVHHNCYEMHRKFLCSKTRDNPVPCMVCSVDSDWPYWTCTWCSLRLCFSCYRKIREVKYRDVFRLRWLVETEEEEKKARQREASESRIDEEEEQQEGKGKGKGKQKEGRRVELKVEEEEKEGEEKEGKEKEGREKEGEEKEGKEKEGEEKEGEEMEGEEKEGKEKEGEEKEGEEKKREKGKQKEEREGEEKKQDKGKQKEEREGEQREEQSPKMADDSTSDKTVRRDSVGR